MPSWAYFLLLKLLPANDKPFNSDQNTPKNQIHSFAVKNNTYFMQKENLW